MGIGGDVAVAVADENEVAEAFELVAGIGDGAGVGGADGGAAGGFDVDAVIGAPLADGAEFGNDGALNRPRKLAFAVGGNNAPAIGGFPRGCFCAGCGRIFFAGGAAGGCFLRRLRGRAPLQHDFLADGKRIGIGKSVDPLQAVDVNAVLAGDAVKRVAAGNDVIGADRQPQHLSHLERVGRFEVVGVDNVAQRQPVAPRDAVERVAAVNHDRFRRAEQRRAPRQPQKQYSRQQFFQRRFDLIKYFTTIYCNREKFNFSFILK